MTQKRTFLLGLTATLLSILVCLIMMEIVLRFFPVATGMKSEPVTQVQPVLRFSPNDDYVWSNKWNFAISNRGRINNDGFVNDQDYDATDSRSLMAVIGDSYVEALMIPYTKTIHGLLSEKAKPGKRVYSFAASGAPLSQYLIWAQYAQQTYKPKAMTFVIIGNDFDESLPQYVRHQTFHQFVKNEKGDFTPRLLNEFHPSWKRSLVQSSALARYIFFNLNIWVAWNNVKQALMRKDVPQEIYVANTNASMNEQRLTDSKQAIDAFFRLLPAYSGLKPKDIAFVVDSNRSWIYEESNAEHPANYFDEMRTYLIVTAQKMGYTVVDMDGPFARHYKDYHQRFEFPSDSHWNELGHTVAAEALEKTPFFQSFLKN
jgi:hypothetical protein